MKEWLFRYQNSKGYSYEEISLGVDMMDTVRRSSFKPYVAVLKDSSTLFLAGDLNLFIPSRD